MSRGFSLGQIGDFHYNCHFTSTLSLSTTNTNHLYYIHTTKDYSMRSSPWPRRVDMSLAPMIPHPL